MVQELNLLSYSTVFSSRPSFISTHISDPEVNELRRYIMHYAVRAYIICLGIRKKICRAN